MKPSLSPSTKSSSIKITKVGVVSTAEESFHKPQTTSSLKSTLSSLQASLQPETITPNNSTTSSWSRLVLLTPTSQTLPSSPLEALPSLSTYSSAVSAKPLFSTSSSPNSTFELPLHRSPTFSPPKPTSSSSKVPVVEVSPSAGPSVNDQTYAVVFSGDCGVVLENKDGFKIQFKLVLTRLLDIYTSDISIHKITCGSVDVMFSVREAKRRNVTAKLRELVKERAFELEYNTMTFVAVNVSELVKPTATVKPSSTTNTSRTQSKEEKKIAFIIFVFAVCIFAALFIFFTVLYFARFSDHRCCKKPERRHKLKHSANPTARTTELELKALSPLYMNLFHKVDYYGESERITLRRERQDGGEFEAEEDQPASTVTALLSENGRVPEVTLKKFNFDDDDSCSSVLFY